MCFILISGVIQKQLGPKEPLIRQISLESIDSASYSIDRNNLNSESEGSNDRAGIKRKCLLLSYSYCKQLVRDQSFISLGTGS